MDGKKKISLSTILLIISIIVIIIMAYFLYKISNEKKVLLENMQLSRDVMQYDNSGVEKEIDEEELADNSNGNVEDGLNVNDELKNFLEHIGDLNLFKDYDLENDDNFKYLNKDDYYNAEKIMSTDAKILKFDSSD